MIYYMYPILLCTIPVHAIFAQNLTEVETKHYFESLAIISLIVVSGCLGLNIVLHNLLLSEFIFCTIFYFLFYGNNLYLRCSSNFLWEKDKTYIPFLLFYFLFNILAALGLYYIFKDVNLLLFSKIIFYFTLFITITMLGNLLNNSKQNAKGILDENEIPEISEEENLPDIYHIVLDCHVGYEKEEYRDNYFFNELEKRGFYNIKNFKSNYNITHLSMPSILNMDYLHNIFHKKENDYYPKSKNQKYYSNNRLWKLLEKLKYRINITVNPMFNKTVENSQININKDLIKGINANLRLLCFSSAFSFLLLPLKRSFKIFNLQFEKYKSFCETSNKTEPVYNFMHILAPHGPLLYDEKGNPLSRKESNDFKNYFSYLKYTDKKTLEIIDTIKQNMKQNSVIIIHGDHGLHFSKNCEFNTLCSVYFPNKKYDIVPENLTAVNLFSLILNQFFGASIDYKTNRFFKANILSNFIFDINDLQNINQNTQIMINNYGLQNFEERLDKLSQKYKNKKVVLYGAGQYFKFIKQNYDLSRLNIIAVSDKKFENIKTPVFDEDAGYNTIAPQKIHTLSPDVVIIAVQETAEIKKYFRDELFKTTRKRFKYTSFEESYESYKKMQKLEWSKVLFP